MFEFAWPWVFLGLPLPWLLRRWLPPASNGEAALRVTHLAELKQLTSQPIHPSSDRAEQRLLYMLLWMMLLCAAARPQWLGDSLPIADSGRDLLVAVDVSGSMEYPDILMNAQPTSRLAVVQQLFGPFISERRGDRVGLILFGSRPYLQAPLTFDLTTVRLWLEQAHVGIAGKETALGDAIGLALKRLRQQHSRSRVLILITDGANTSGEVPPLVAAHLAASEGVRIYTLGIGADQSDAPALADLDITAGLDLDEPLLREIANMSQGRYFRVRSPQELLHITQTLDELEPVARPIAYNVHITPLYPWPLGIALLISVVRALLLWQVNRHTRSRP